MKFTFDSLTVKSEVFLIEIIVGFSLEKALETCVRNIVPMIKCNARFSDSHLAFGIMVTCCIIVTGKSTQLSRFLDAIFVI